MYVEKEKSKINSKKNKQTKKVNTIAAGSRKGGKGWLQGRRRPTDVRTSYAKYKNISHGKLILVREKSGKFALLKLWTPETGLCFYHASLPSYATDLYNKGWVVVW